MSYTFWCVYSVQVTTALNHTANYECVSTLDPFMKPVVEVDQLFCTIDSEYGHGHYVCVVQ